MPGGRSGSRVDRPVPPELVWAERRGRRHDIDMHWLNQISHPNLRAVEHNIVTDDVAVLGTFDLIHVRFVLHHLGNAEGIGALRRLIGLLRPGGRILVEDVLDFGLGDEGSARGRDYSE